MAAAATFVLAPGGAAQGPLTNGCFETGMTAPWTIEYGTRGHGSTDWTTISSSHGGQPAATVITSTSPLAFCQPVRVLPFEGNFAVQLNDLSGGYHATRITQSFYPTAFDLTASGVLTMDIAVMLVDPGHSDGDNPGFFGELLINGKELPYGGHYLVESNHAAAEGWQMVGTCQSNPPSTTLDPIWYKRFKPCVDLHQLTPNDLITVRLTVWDCACGGHGGMAWADCLHWEYCTPPPSGMVGWWYDMTVRDLAGPAYNDGALVGSAAPSQCQKIGPALRHNAITYARVPDHADLNFPANQDFSVDLWALPRIRSGRLDPLVSKICWNSSGFSSGYWFYLDDGNPTLLLASGSTFTMHKDTSVKVPLNEWIHLAVTVDRSSTTPQVLFYMSGDLLTGVTPAPLLGDLTSTNEFRIGGPPCGNQFKDLFSGCTDEIELFRRVLTPLEVSTLATNCKGKCKPCFETPLPLAANTGLSDPTASGNMFDVVVTSAEALDVCALSVQPYNFAGPFQVDVYMTPNTYVGKTGTPAAWTLVATGSGVTPGGTPTTAPLVDCTLNAPFTLMAGNYGLAVYIRNPAGPTGVAHGVYPPASGNAPPYAAVDLTVVPSPTTAPGVATVGPFGASTSNRLFSGTIHYTKASVNAGNVPCSYSVASYGSGCYNQPASFRESFSASSFDLANSSLSLIYLGSGYTVIAGAAAFVPPGAATSLPLGDDTSVVVNLSAPLLYPGGVTTSLEVCSNGFVSPVGSNGLGSDPTVDAFLAGAPRWASWHDFEPDAVHSVTFEETAGVAYLTWNNVPDFSLPGTANTLQFQFDTNTNQVNLVWGNMSGQGNGHLVGWTIGGGALDGGNLDLSVATPFSIGATDVRALSLSASPDANLGATVDLTTTNATGVGIGICFVTLADLPFSPAGFDLGVIGAPGCVANVDINQSIGFVISSVSSMTVSLPIPAGPPALVGQSVYCQSVWLDPAVNAFGGVTSNAVRLTILP